MVHRVSLRDCFIVSGSQKGVYDVDVDAIDVSSTFVRVTVLALPAAIQ